MKAVEKATEQEPEKTVPSKQYDEAIEKVGKLEAENAELRSAVGQLQQSNATLVMTLKVQAKALTS